jgi:hypothetical protein
VTPWKAQRGRRFARHERLHGQIVVDRETLSPTTIPIVAGATGERRARATLFV